jgi:hypothetical protein
MTLNIQSIKDALNQHCLDSLGHIYTITVDDVTDYLEKELPEDWRSQLAGMDEVNLANRITDAIGNAGIMELIEGAICEAVKTQIQTGRENVSEALCESEFIEAQL